MRFLRDAALSFVMILLGLAAIVALLFGAPLLIFNLLPFAFDDQRLAFGVVQLVWFALLGAVFFALMGDSAPKQDGDKHYRGGRTNGVLHAEEMDDRQLVEHLLGSAAEHATDDYDRGYWEGVRMELSKRGMV